MRMEIKHTHPQYDSPQQRHEQMADAYAACLTRLRELRAAEGKPL